MRIAFFSSSPLATSLLEKLRMDFEVVLTVNTKEKMDADFAKRIKILKIDLAVVIDYGLLIPKLVYNAPRFGTINIHFSLLPKYRGSNPDAFVILKGEKRTGISFVLIDEGFDTGDILAQKEVDILPNETAGELHQRLYVETEKIIAYIIDSWVKWKLGKNYNRYNSYNNYTRLFLPPQKQNNTSATYTKKLGREDGFVEWEKLIYADFYLYDLWRALSPWPGMWTRVIINGQEKRLKILKTRFEGKSFIIDKVQLEGKKPVGWKQFKKAYGI